MPEVIAAYYSDNWDTETEFISILGSKAFYTEADAKDSAEYGVSGDTGDGFLDLGVSHIQVLAWRLGEEYTYKVAKPPYLRTVVLDRNIYTTVLYGNREIVSPEKHRISPYLKQPRKRDKRGRFLRQQRRDLKGRFAR